MPTDTAALERALWIIAVCLMLQTLLFTSAAVGAYLAWRRAAAALVQARMTAERQASELRTHLEHMSATVDEAARALLKGSSAVDEAVNDMRDAMGSVRTSVGSVASVVTAPRAALALGLWRGFQMWRNRRAARRVDPDPRQDLQWQKGEGS